MLTEFSGKRFWEFPMKKLKKKQREVLETLVKSGITEGFYLAGGTALLLRYNHRESEDFDFFSFPERDFDFFRLVKKLPENSFRVEELKKDTLIFFLNGVRCSFFEYSYPVLNPPEKSRELGICVASDEDIAAMKSVAITQRGSKKDFFDLYFLIRKHGWRLEEVIELSKRKYGNVFPESAFVKALTYFKDADEESYKDIDLKWKEVKEFFARTVDSYVKSL
jgi:predicted nucleotidyltransferase component of viral defense system